MKRILSKVQEMKDQRSSLEKQLRDLIHQDDITSVLVTTERADMKVLSYRISDKSLGLYLTRTGFAHPGRRVDYSFMLFLHVHYLVLSKSVCTRFRSDLLI